jgi:hypothetical protein
MECQLKFLENTKEVSQINDLKKNQYKLKANSLWTAFKTKQTLSYIKDKLYDLFFINDKITVDPVNTSGDYSKMTQDFQAGSIKA